MARQKSKPKDPIRVWFKKLASGSQAVYLVFHEHGKRTYENLGLYIIPERTQADKVQNANTLLTVNTIKAQRIVELANGKAHIKQNTTSGKMLLMDWLELCKNTKLKQGQSKSVFGTISNLMLHLQEYRGNKITMQQVDEAYCEGFINYLSNCKILAKHKPEESQPEESQPEESQPEENKILTKGSANLYFTAFASALNDAVRKGIIESNPINQLSKEARKPISPKASTRTYLTIEEIKALKAARCPNEVVKQAFLFACFCGLRISDIEKLRWDEIQENGKQLYICTEMKKTQTTIVVPLSDEAKKWMPKRKSTYSTETIFDLPKRQTTQRDIKVWAERAGITKDVVFHTSRHTFATTALSLGADLYTVSKLLGHQNLKTTQIYAEIVNRKKAEAVNLFNGLLESK